MIRFHLKCDQNHQFESWFQSGEAFDKLAASGMVNCTSCGSTTVSKSMMAPSVSTSSDIAKPSPRTAPKDDIESSISKLREKVEATSDYVGTSFAKEARAMHEGTTPERPIYGEAKPDEARKLIADGVPVLPLPFIPRKRVN